ncbi:hypothetical protein BCR44DRAFT_364621 [Catenaria anguillulae PL171]|uniref:Alpha/Beta hydrolase protein n=1 Tax=Catenaria anguillulae PL171 TaxID=765915 RepID=A0A1Y2H8N7_9FUNG|nr:hypothetical protein BCR44DRAFT_364621 [Catenaria anguillulae PL171]
MILTNTRFTRGLPFLLSAIGLIGAVAHGIASATGSLSNEYLGVWFAGILFWQGCELYLVLHKVTSWRRTGLLYFALLSLISLATVIAYIYAQDAIGIGWNIVIVLAFLVIFFTLLRINKGQYETLSAPTAKLHCCLTVIRVACRVFILFILCLLFAGAIGAAIPKSFPMPGQLVPVTMTDGRKTNLHAYCTGPTNSGKPTFWFLSSPAHGVVDFYGVQTYLSRANRRACTLDMPGFGWSDPVLANQQDPLIYLKPMIDAANAAMGNGNDAILVGWGAGGETAIRYLRSSIQSTTRVTGIMFVTVYPEIQGTASYASVSDLQGRIGLANIILGLAIPWGLMPVFFPPNSVPKGYFPPEKAAEFRVQLWTSKSWINQREGIKHQIQTFGQPSALQTFTPAVSVPLAHVYCNLSDAQVCERPGVKDCPKAQQENRLAVQEQVRVTNGLQSNARLIGNTDLDCSLDMPVSKPEYTAAKILEAFP